MFGASNNLKRLNKERRVNAVNQIEGGVKMMSKPKTAKLVSLAVIFFLLSNSSLLGQSGQSDQSFDGSQSTDGQIEFAEETDICSQLELESADGEQDAKPRTRPLTQSIDQIDLSLAAPYKTPKLLPLPRTSATATTPITPKPCYWTAPNVTYQNLLFEEPLLERHGISENFHTQPLKSGLKFFTRGFIAPLDVIKKHHKCCDSPLGWGTPGSYCR